MILWTWNLKYSKKGFFVLFLTWYFLIVKHSLTDSIQKPVKLQYQTRNYIISNFQIHARITKTQRMIQPLGNEVLDISFRKIVKHQNQIVEVLPMDGIDLQVLQEVKCLLLVLKNELVVSVKLIIFFFCGLWFRLIVGRQLVNTKEWFLK